MLKGLRHYSLNSVQRLFMNLQPSTKQVAIVFRGFHRLKETPPLTDSKASLIALSRPPTKDLDSRALYPREDSLLRQHSLDIHVDRFFGVSLR